MIKSAEQIFAWQIFLRLWSEKIFFRKEVDYGTMVEKSGILSDLYA